MVEKHNHINFRVLADLGVKLEVSDDGVKSAETAAEIVKARRGHELLVHANKLGGHCVADVKLEVNNLR